MDLVNRLRKQADASMPEWAHKSSSYWYDGHPMGRKDRDRALLLREAADEIERLRG